MMSRMSIPTRTSPTRCWRNFDDFAFSVFYERLKCGLSFWGRVGVKGSEQIALGR